MVSALVEATETSGPGVQEDPVAALPADRRADDVDRADDLAALAPQLLDRHQRVDGLARLGDRDVERVRVDDRGPVAELARGLGVGRDPGQLLDQGGAHLAGVVGGSAAEELDVLDVPQLAGVEVDAAEPGRREALLEAAAQRPADGARLLVDLLAHVVAELAELVVVGVGVDRGRHLAAVAVAFQGLPVSVVVW